VRTIATGMPREALDRDCRALHVDCDRAAVLLGRSFPAAFAMTAAS